MDEQDPAASQAVEEILAQLGAGDSRAWDKLMPFVYRELKLQAERYLRRERPDHSLSASALVNEAYLRLVNKKDLGHNRSHFLALASMEMRRVLVDHARRKRAAKRGAGKARVSFEDQFVMTEDHLGSVLALEEALDELERRNPRYNRIVTCRFYGGMTWAEVADALGTNIDQVKRDWKEIRAFLQRRFQAAAAEAAPDGEDGED